MTRARKYPSLSVVVERSTPTPSQQEDFLGPITAETTTKNDFTSNRGAITSHDLPISISQEPATEGWKASTWRRMVMCMRTPQVPHYNLRLRTPILLEEDPRIARGDDTQPAWALRYRRDDAALKSPYIRVESGKASRVREHAPGGHMGRCGAAKGASVASGFPGLNGICAEPSPVKRQG